jgi:integrase
MQRGQIIPRGDNKYLLRVYAGRDGGGKRIYVSKTFEGTISAARKALTAMNSDKDTKTLVVPMRTNMKDFLTGWVESKQDLSPRSRRQYRDIINKKLVPALGAIRLTALESQAVQRMVNELVKKGYSANTIEYVHRVLHSALEWACKMRLIHRNPADNIMKPKREKTVTADSVFSREEVQELLQSCKGDRLGPLWTLLVGTGLRPGEAVALTWDAVTLEGDPQVSVHRMNVDASIVNQVKTRASRRVVSLPGFVVEALRVNASSRRSFVFALVQTIKTTTLCLQRSSEGRSMWLISVSLGIAFSSARSSAASACTTCGIPMPLYSSQAEPIFGGFLLDSVTRTFKSLLRYTLT